MKLHTTQNSLQTNSTGESLNFGIGDVSTIIEILQSRLYKNKVKTVVQEYLSNSKDSHTEVGRQDNEFIVTVPTHLNPVFKTRDFGLGVTPERMANVFVLYGSSTKRNDNTQIGGLGLGAKSAWAISDSFSIVTYVDGIKRSYVAHVGANRQGRLDLVTTEKTDEKNGTEIQIPANKNDIYEFRDSIFRATYFWDSRPIFKGVTDVPTRIEGYKIGVNAEIINRELLPSFVDGRYNDNPLLVISGIPYEVESDLLAKCKTLNKLTEFIEKKLVLHIGNGVVDVAASREELADSPRTVEAIEKLAHKVGVEIKTHIHSEFGKVKSPSEWFATYQSLSKYFKIEQGFAKFQDYSIKDEYIVGAPLNKVKITHIHCLSRSRWNQRKIEKITKKTQEGLEKQIKLELFPHTFYLNSDLSAVEQNKRIKEYFIQNKEMYLIESMGNPSDLDKVIKDLGIKDFSALTYPIIPKEEKVKVQREKEQLCLHSLSHGHNRYEYTTLASNTQKYLYVEVYASKGGGFSYGYDVQELKDLDAYLDLKGYAICGLAERALKMVKGEANFSSLKDYLDAWKPEAKEINYVRTSKQKNRDYVDVLEQLKGVKDTELTDIVKEYKRNSSTRVATLPAILVRKVEKEQEVVDFVKQDEDVSKLIKKHYSLLDKLTTSYYGRTQGMQEVTYYLNAKFSEK